MLVKLGLRQSKRQLKANIFHLITLTIIFMITFILATYTFDKDLTANLTSSISSNWLERIGGMGSIFKSFLIVTIIVNLFFLTYIFRIRLRQNAKMYALYRLLGMGNRDLFILYLFEMITFTLVAVIIGGLFGVAVIRVCKIILLSLGNFFETKVEFTFSPLSYFVSVVIYFLEMIIAMLFSFVVIIRTDIILLFKRDQLVQKISKATPFYIAISVVLFCLLPHFAKIGDDLSSFLTNFCISLCISAVAMFFLYKSGITSLFALRRFFGLNKRHGSEFITGRFFFSQLNKSAMMMTIVSIFLTGIFLFTFISQMFTSSETLAKTTTNDFSMLDARNDDVREVEKYLQNSKLEYYETDFEYLHIVTNPNNKVHFNATDIQNMIQKTRSDEKAMNQTVQTKQSFEITEYENSFIISEQMYEQQIAQLKKANRNTYQSIEKLYNVQDKTKVRQISGGTQSNIALLPNTEVAAVHNISAVDFKTALSVRFFDHPIIGPKGSMLTLALDSATFVVSNTEYEHLKDFGLVRKMKVFNTPSMTVNQFKKLYEETPLHNYEMDTTAGKMSVQSINVEIQSPIMFCLVVLFFQVLFYIVILIVYRLSEMMEKQRKTFETLHIVGASDTTIIGSIAIQTGITMLFPIIVSFYVSWIAVSGVFNQFYTSNEIFTNVSKYLPHVSIAFLAITIIFVCYQSVGIRRQFKS